MSLRVSPRCWSGYNSFGSTLASRARFLRRRSRRSCACSSVDEPQLAGIGHQNLMSALLQDPACPRGVGSGLNCDAQRRPLGGEASFESLGVSAQSRPSSITSPLSVSMRHRGRSICLRGPIRLSCVDAVCYHPWWADPPFYWASEPVEHICRPTKGTAYGGSAFSSHLRRNVHALR